MRKCIKTKITSQQDLTTSPNSASSSPASSSVGLLASSPKGESVGLRHGRLSATTHGINTHHPMLISQCGGNSHEKTKDNNDNLGRLEASTSTTHHSYSYPQIRSSRGGIGHTSQSSPLSVAVVSNAGATNPSDHNHLLECSPQNKNPEGQFQRTINEI